MLSGYVKRHCASTNFFELNMKYLYFVGLWPNETLPKKRRILYKMYQYTLNIFSIMFLAMTGIKTYQIKHDLNRFLTNVDMSIVSYNFFIKVIFFFIKRDKIKELIDDIIASKDHVSEKNRHYMIKHLILITAFMTFALFTFSLLGLYIGEMVIEGWMPFDPLKTKLNLLLSTQIMAVMFCVPFSYRSIGMQGIVCSLMLYMCDQLTSLQKDVKNLQYTKETEIEMRESLKKVVVKHIRLMRYSLLMDSIFYEYFFVQNLAVTIEICLNAVMVSMVDTEQKSLYAGFVTFLIIALLNHYIYCYLGNELIDQSQGVAYAAYCADWTKWPVDVQKNLLLIIKVAQKPLKMSAGGINIISIQCFTTALYNGYSIFAVLNDVVK